MSRRVRVGGFAALCLGVTILLASCSGTTGASSNNVGTGNSGSDATTTSQNSSADGGAQGSSSSQQSVAPPASAGSDGAVSGSSGNGSVAGDFSIEGKWKAVGGSGYGQAQVGAIIAFDGTHANLYSPADTYALVKTSSGYQLDLTGLLGDSQVLNVQVVDNNNINLYTSSPSAPLVELTRLS